MAYRTISITSNQPPKEGVAYGTIYPGMILERTSTADQVRVHSGLADKVFANLVAVEDSLQGNDVDDAYSSTNRIFFKSFLPGDEILGKVAAGQNISIGDELVSNGAGYLKKYFRDSSSGDMENTVFATALEACVATSATLCRMEIA